MLLNFSELQFSHLQNGRSDAYLVELQGRRNEEIEVEMLWCPVQSWCPGDAARFSWPLRSSFILLSRVEMNVYGDLE